MLPARVQQSSCGQENAPQQVNINFNSAPSQRHPKTNKHTEQRGIHHRCFCFDNSLCFSITIIGPELDKGSGRGWKMETQWIWPATNRKKILSCAVGNDSSAQTLQGVGDYILILNSHFSGSVWMEPTGTVKKALIWKWFHKGKKEKKDGIQKFLDFCFFPGVVFDEQQQKMIKKQSKEKLPHV